MELSNVTAITGDRLERLKLFVRQARMLAQGAYVMVEDPVAREDVRAVYQHLHDVEKWLVSWLPVEGQEQAEAVGTTCESEVLH